MFRNIYYDRKNSTIHQWSWDVVTGDRIKFEIPFKPYLYVKSVTGNHDAIGIDDVKLKKMEFATDWEKNNFLKTYKGKVYFDLPPTQQYLLETYYNTDILELTKFPLRTFFYDIEVIADEFPSPLETKFPITSITIYDTLTAKFHVWGIKPYDPQSCTKHLDKVTPDEVVYYTCADETHLLKEFIRFWRRNFPDVIVGYNSHSFDMPYIVNRINKVFGDGKSSLLSPVNNIYGVEKQTKFGQSYIEYSIGGVSHLDYMVLFKTYTPGERESDSLDFVCKTEIGVGKIDYEGESLHSLFEKDWEKFINYNIWDVKLMMMLDEKRKYLNIAKFSAFNGFANIDKALGKTYIIAGALAKQALQRGKIISTQREGEKETIPGGYVKQPEIGLYEGIISFDVNSLYPNTVITLNISPETKRAKIIKASADQIDFYDFIEKRNFSVKKVDFDDFMKSHKYCVSASGIVFDQSKKGICNEWADDLYKKRKQVQKEMKELYKDKEKNSLLIDQKDTEQYLYKILLNSMYGALANRFFALYDIDCAKSITTTGQAMIKEAEKIINGYLEKTYDIKEDFVAAQDTDSAYVCLASVLKKTGIKITDDQNNLTEEFTKLENNLQNVLNKEIVEWAQTKLRTVDCRFFFKRESVCPKAMWVSKKHYTMHIINQEGEKIDKIKYKGMNLVKSTTSDAAKNIAKDIVEGILRSADKKEANDKFYEYYEKFMSLSIKEISVRKSIKVLDEWKKYSKLGPIKGAQQHVKYSLYYNEMLKELNLQNKYPTIESGKKIKMIYLKPNKYDIEGIAYLDDLPPEFNLEPDKDKMFEKCITNSIKAVYNALNWSIPNPKLQFESSVAEIFG